jgi:hypothetical protein
MPKAIFVFCFLTTIICIDFTGEQVLRMLENGVSQYPKLEGRFPQESHLDLIRLERLALALIRSLYILETTT